MVGRFIVKDVICGGAIVASRILDPKDGIYKLCDFRRIGPTALISQANERGRIWHERLGYLNFRSMKMMVTQNMVIGIQNTIPLDGVCRGFMPGKHH